MAHWSIWYYKGNLLMYEIYEGDFLLFTTNDVEEVEYYRIEGYIVRKI